MLDAANERLRAFQDGIPHLAWTARVDGSKDYVNARWKEYTGRTQEELLDWSWLDLVHPDDRVRHERDWRLAMEAGERYQEHLRIRRHDGIYRWHAMRDWPTRDAAGRITHWFGTATDVDDQHHLEDRLRAAKESAESANRAKSEFLATMSHEIRTPMNGIIGMTNLLQETALADDQRIYADDVRTSAEHLLVIINSILDFSKIDAGRIQLEAQAFNLRDLVEDVCALLNEQAYEKQLELSCLIERSVPDRVIGDESKLRQVLLNLIGNGVKFTQVGEVSIAVTMAEDQGGAGDAVRFAVRDTGIGMPPEAIPRLFQAFSQGDSTMSRRFGGTGLGLAISKGLVDAMGGTLDVESTPGQGTAFTVGLEFGRLDDGSRLLAVADSLATTRVLCVDDNPHLLRSLELHLQRLGIRPVCVGDARSAMAAARDGAAAKEPFDVIFLDNHLPQMLGLALARSLTLIPSAKAPRCVLLTSSSRNPPPDNGLTRIALYLQKPFRFRQVRHCIEAIRGIGTGSFEKRRLARQDGNRLVASPFHGRRVLVAEDNPINQRLTSHILAKFGLVVDVVANGREAVHAARLTRYDVILMDCQMPEMDGYQATAMIRQGGAGASVPIVALTANAMPSDKQRCLAAGMDHYLAKPFTQPALIEVLSFCLAGAQTATPLANPASAGAVHPASPSAPALPAIDREVMASLSQSIPDGDATVAELVGMFKQDSPGQLSILREAGGSGDGHTLSRVAHRMKSGCRTLGFKAMEAICIDLERAGQESRMDGAMVSCDDLAEAYAEVLRELP